MKQKTKQLIMTLVALLALTTHAWADDPTVYDSGDVELSSLQEGDILMPGVKLTNGNPTLVTAYLYGNRYSINEEIRTMTFRISSNPFSIGLNGLMKAYLAGNGPYDCMPITEDGKAGNAWVVAYISTASYNANMKDIYIGGIKVTPPATPFAITWSAATPNTASIDKMPAGNVTVSVEYFPQAEFAKSTDATPVALAPAAIANVPANTDAPIVTPGTVANIGTTDVKQGTLKYLVIQPTDNTVPDTPDYDDERWSKNVPTANELKQGDVYVWYYIEGAEPDNIADRTDDNTRSDSDIKPLGANGIVTLGAEPTYDVTLNAEGLSDEEAAAWKVAKGTDQPAAFPLEGVKKSETVTVTYSGTKKIIGVNAEKAEEPVTLATPLTIEALTAGTIKVNITDGYDAYMLQTGMKYSKDGGTTKTLITESEDIPVAKGDKVQFYGNGTQTQAYYIQHVMSVSINGSGEGFQTKVYGNIMSLLNETGFATNTELPNNDNVFTGLFYNNLTLSDASELLLPATELTENCYYCMFQDCQLLTAAPKLPAMTLASSCYEGMFLGCTSLTTAPKLPATTLATRCYGGMFFGCTNLTNAYVKAAYTVGDYECDNMFTGCSATGAILHTTPDNKASWEDKMGTGKTWSNWTVADEWQE